MDNSFSESNEWFTRLFGFEEVPNQVASHFSLSKDRNGDIMITSKDNGKSYSVGNFQIRDLKSFKDLQEIGGGTLNLLVGNGSQTVDADIITCETNPENNGATFQMASNFNCLDHMPYKKPPMGYLSYYVTSHEQGGPGTVACGPALVYRQYLLPHPSGRIGQMDEDVQLLSRTPAEVIDGYVHYLPPLFNWSNPDNYQVGVHQNIDVTLGRSGNRGNQFRIVENQRIHQVFCSTLCFGYVEKSNANLKIAENILSNEYKLTVLSAWENSLKYPGKKGSKKLFLCLIGGGAFGNPIDLICRSISSAVELIIKSGLEVYLVCFNKNEYNKVIQYIKNDVEKTGGKEIFL
ncbi:hypothetical protein GPJ56_009011 [Histomonas meleagridis]|uniref:uncharacterized protein n=1 Tax=Histomonas meleagridis TaxID=135588 RepID=UPI00355A3768|nr:hypothetical protein GPJ56_009011 [Histomonas meleagridis]KAH0799334.1 hypothetical protein GO595_008131 [Histomonas meleagridis]